MAATKYLDYDGLLYFWSLIKAKLALKADAQSVTAGSYGPSADASPAHSGTFKVPYVQVTSQGVVTAISEKTITLPASGNTDTKVKQTVSTDNGEYPILAKETTATTTVTGESKFAAAVTVNPSTGTVSATKFNGAVDGNANTATEFASAQSVTLTGDVTGTASSTAGWSVATTLANSGVTAGTYKSVTVDAKGRVTAGTNPTTLSGFGITDAYTKTEIDTKLTSAMHYKGSVTAVANLPSTGNAVGDFYNVTATGENYAWTGSEWDVTGSIVDLQSITNAEIDTVVAS